MLTLSSANTKKPTHAYTIVYFKTKNGIQILSGREAALSQKGLNALKRHLGTLSTDELTALHHLIENQQPLLDEQGANPDFKIGRNLMGAMLIGRSALAGGGYDRKLDRTILDTALRELKEEIHLANVPAGQLTDLAKRTVDAKRCEQYYLLDLATINANPEKFAQQCVSKFRATNKQNNEKRDLEIISLEQYGGLLAAPDNQDQIHITASMKTLAKVFCDTLSRLANQPISAAARQNLEQELTESQLARPLTGHVDAVAMFLKQQQQSATATTSTSTNSTSSASTSTNSTSSANASAYASTSTNVEAPATMAQTSTSLTSTTYR